jgi:hypothetical protein
MCFCRNQEGRKPPYNCNAASILAPALPWSGSFTSRSAMRITTPKQLTRGRSSATFRTETHIYVSVSRFWRETRFECAFLASVYSSSPPTLLSLGTAATFPYRSEPCLR